MTLAIGARISNRGEDFIILDTRINFDGSQIIEVEGISELVKGKRFQFDTKVEPTIKTLDPKNTTLIADTDSGYRKTKLFLETQIRNSPSSTDRISIAHKAAYNRADFQFVPTLQAFKLPRPRLLIADGVGLGKTIEVGIFLSEMMKRGKGQRVLILALKSILSQFQQELWNRFSIPLMRLDSRGIALIKSELPLNKNPFEYYDKTIISIDTLKNNVKFQRYIDKTRWDIIVIDECHTVANSTTQRGNLAQLLATKCESLILTSATPHNGRKESFANLINMIEPIAIPRNGNYTKADVEDYYVRRFKQHIMDDEVRSNFQDREVLPIHADFNQAEEDFLEEQQNIKFQAKKAIDEGDSATGNRDFLFSIGLFKSYMSSPAATLSTLTNRKTRIESKEDVDDYEGEIAVLDGLIDKVKTIIDLKQDSKYASFKNKLLDIGWAGKLSNERIVVFAERIDTITYLKENLTSDFNLPAGRIETFHGGLSDIEQQEIIDDFGKEDSEIRILIASDAGSQGVNLHYFCNTMFNYDIPWSLITLEQRNGRIDRYGQKNTPYIYYLIGKSDLKGLKTDLHIIEKLTEKEEEVYNALGDVSTVMKLYDTQEEEKSIVEAIKNENDNYLNEEYDTSGLFEEDSDVNTHSIPEQPIAETSSLYPNDSAYYTNLIDQLKADGFVKANDAQKVDESYFEIRNNDDLNRILFDIPPAAKPQKNDLYHLSLDKKLIQSSIDDARKKKGQWAKFHMMYDLHPVIKYFMSKLEASVDKDVALVAKITQLPKGTAWFVMKGQVANNLGQNVLSEFFVVPLKINGGLHENSIPLDNFIDRFDIDGDLYTQAISEEELSHLHELRDFAVEFALQNYMHQKQQLAQLKMENKQQVYHEKLKNWKRDSDQQMAIDFDATSLFGVLKNKKEKRTLEIKTILDESSQYFKDVTSMSKDAYIQIVTVFFNA